MRRSVPARFPRLGGSIFEEGSALDSVGINRREVVNERVIQERRSESILTPSHVRAVGTTRHLKRWTGESHSGIVPTKRSNAGRGGPKEIVEGRPLTKENAEEPNPYRTPSRESGPSGLDRVSQAAFAAATTT